MPVYAIPKNIRALEESVVNIAIKRRAAARDCTNYGVFRTVSSYTTYTVNGETEMSEAKVEVEKCPRAIRESSTRDGFG